MQYDVDSDRVKVSSTSGCVSHAAAEDIHVLECNDGFAFRVSGTNDQLDGIKSYNNEYISSDLR